MSTTPEVVGERDLNRCEWWTAEQPPNNARLVIATDLEGQFMAIYELGQWFNAETDEPFDSVITHWTERLQLPDES